MQLYDPEAVGNLLGVTPATLCNWRTKGVGPGFIKRGHYCYYTAEKLEAYLDKIGPIPEGLDAWEKRRFFTEAHRPEVIHETPKEAATLAKLADRLAVVEKALAKIRRNQKRKPLVPALPS